MPITRKQFDLGIDHLIERWMLKIHELLSQHRDKAYSEEELKAALSYLPIAEGTIAELAHVKRRHPAEAALEKLVELGAIEARIVESKTYYAYLGELPL